jgi:hypothetical protein
MALYWVASWVYINCKLIAWCVLLGKLLTDTVRSGACLVINSVTRLACCLEMHLINNLD